MPQAKWTKYVYDPGLLGRERKTLRKLVPRSSTDSDFQQQVNAMVASVSAAVLALVKDSRVPLTQCPRRSKQISLTMRLNDLDLCCTR